MSVTVHSFVELVAALAMAAGGDTILVAPGRYPGGAIIGAAFDAPVTVRPADPASPPVLTEPLVVRDARHLVVQGLHFAPDKVAAHDNASLVTVANSQDVVLRDLRLHARVPGPGEGLPRGSRIDTAERRALPIEGLGFGLGLSIRDSARILAEGNEITGFRTGLYLHGLTDTTVRRNLIHRLRSDGINLLDVRNLTIEFNVVGNFTTLANYDYPSLEDHPDFLQYWATNAQFGIRGLKIQGNAFLQGAGDWSQGIFGHYGVIKADAEAIRFEDFEISDNLVITSHLNGISIGDVRNARVHHNTMLPAPPDPALPSSVPGYPSLNILTNARLDPGGGWDLSRGALPERIEIERNILVAPEGPLVFGVNREPRVRDRLTGTARDNRVLGWDLAHPDYWGTAFPGAVDGLFGPDGVALFAEAGVRRLDPWVAAQIATLQNPPRPRRIGTAAGDDLVAGDAGTTLLGLGGDDRLSGGPGHDALVGGPGDDRLTGGPGADTFSISIWPGTLGEIDTIADLDFEAGDIIAFKDGFKPQMFRADVDPDNTFRWVGAGAIANSMEDLRELARLPGVEARPDGAGGTLFRFAGAGGRAVFGLHLVGVRL